MQTQEPVRHARRWIRIRLSVRTLMVLVLVIAAAIGWKILDFRERMRRQREAVLAIKDAGGVVRQASQATIGNGRANLWPKPPEWLTRFLKGYAHPTVTA